MSQVWFTADTHLGHANIIKFCQRPFLSEAEQELLKEDPRGRWKVSRQSINHHDEALIAAINDSAVEQDTLWILGDFCWGEHEEAARYLNRFRCKNVNLVWGNHDHRSIGPLFQRAVEQCKIKVKGQKIWLNHYPMRSWDASFHGSWHLYGHVHARLQVEDQQQQWRLTRDVGVDACDYRPISFEELSDYMAPRLKTFTEHRDQMT